MSKRVQIFSISPNYTRCRIWEATPKHDLIGTSTITLNKGLTRRERYDIIDKWLSKNSIPVPDYVPTKRERIAKERQ